VQKLVNRLLLDDGSAAKRGGAGYHSEAGAGAAPTIRVQRNRFIERQAQCAQLGKAARREIRESTRRWHKALGLGDDGIADLAKGLLKTDKQIRYAREVECMLGQWTGR
jgi:hypothetical protein